MASYWLPGGPAPVLTCYGRKLARLICSCIIELRGVAVAVHGRQVVMGCQICPYDRSHLIYKLFAI